MKVDLIPWKLVEACMEVDLLTWQLVELTSMEIFHGCEFTSMEVGESFHGS